MMKSCSNCSNCEFVTDKWDQGQIIGSYDACKLDNTVLTDINVLSDCEHWKLREIKSFDFTIRKEKLKCPF